MTTPCSGDCESRFALKSNGAAYRRALFRLERGVCVACRLDCHSLVKRLQVPGAGAVPAGGGCVAGSATVFGWHESVGLLCSAQGLGWASFHTPPTATPQAVEKGSRDWEEQRRRIIAAHAPRLAVGGWADQCGACLLAWLAR